MMVTHRAGRGTYRHGWSYIFEPNHKLSAAKTITETQNTKKKKTLYGQKRNKKSLLVLGVGIENFETFASRLDEHNAMVLTAHHNTRDSVRGIRKKNY